jgi:hypothetical protein
MAAKRTTRKLAAASKSADDEHVMIGISPVNPSDLKALRIAWKSRQLVFFLGAGVSLPYGLPTWKNLVLELLFEQAAHTRRLGRMWPHYRRALASWMTDYFDYNPLVLARMVEQTLRREAKKGASSSAAPDDEAVARAFIEKLRARLYANFKPPTGGNTALQAIARLVKLNTASQGVAAAVTFNYDDLLEQELKAVGVDVFSVVDGQRPQGSAFRVFHPHGYVPKDGAAGRSTLVFTEDDYHKLTESSFHWGLSEIVNYLRKQTVLFVGLSMSDPNVRRLLDASKNWKIPPHRQIQKRHSVSAAEMPEVLRDVARRALQHGEMLDRHDEHKDQDELKAAIGEALRQADTYDREVFESMGVKTIWLEDWNDLTTLIDRIST